MDQRDLQDPQADKDQQGQRESRVRQDPLVQRGPLVHKERLEIQVQRVQRAGILDLQDSHIQVKRDPQDQQAL